MKTVVLGIRKEGRAAHYVVDVDVDGEIKHFVMNVVSDDAVRPLDREFVVLQRHRLVLDDVVPLVLSFHAGERLSFPIDLHMM